MVQAGWQRVCKWTSEGEVNPSSRAGAFPLQKEECDSIRKVGMSYANSGGTAEIEILSCVSFLRRGTFYLKPFYESAKKKRGESI